MEQRNSKSTNGNVFKRLKTTNKNKIAYEGGEDFMKKILSVFVAIAMLLSLVAPFKVPTASAAAPVNAKITTGTKLKAADFIGLSVYSPTKPDFGIPGTKINLYEPGIVFTMGDIIAGYLIDSTGALVTPAPTTPWVVDLRSYNGATTYQSVSMAGGSIYFTIPTGNIPFDGEYQLYIHSTTSEFAAITINNIYIKYNLQLTVSNVKACPGYQKIEGYVTRANGQDVSGTTVYVKVAYPDGKLAASQPIYPWTSGQFSLTFPADENGDGYAEIGTYRIFITDNYGNTATENDAIIYKSISNAPDISMTVSTYITPFIYKSQNGQPLLLVVRDQNGNPVTGLLQTDWTVSPSAVTVVSYAEISPGFYRFVLNSVGDAVDVRFMVTKSFYGTPVDSNQIIINTRDPGIFNPYIDITTSVQPWKLDDIQASVYDKLPCTVGNSFTIEVGSWPIPTAMKKDWYVFGSSLTGTTYWTISGPIKRIGSNGKPANPKAAYNLGASDRFFVTQSGKISVTINLTAWERVNKTCPEWPIISGTGESAKVDEDTMSLNACCHTYTKTIDICEVKSCTYGGVTLSGSNITDSKTVEVGKKVDKVSVSIDPTGAPTDLTCSCPNYVVMMYMVDGSGKLAPNAFTVDTWTGTPVKGSLIWYNPVNALGPDKGPDPDKDLSVLKDQPVQTFLPTGIYTSNSSSGFVSNALKFSDCPFGLQGITFNYPTGATDCNYTLVIKVFGLSRKFDACGNMDLTYPMIAETFNEIKVTPTVTNLDATYTLTEGNVDPDEMLAGVTNLIDVTITAPATLPGFSYDNGDTDWNPPTWAYYFNGTLLAISDEYAVSVTPSKTGKASYRFVLSQPFSSDGTFKIVGTSYYNASGYECTKKEVVTIEIKVVKPEFTVSIGLKDCDKTVIDSDGILTEGFDELVYVKAVDPRGVHDFSTDPNWNLSALAAVNDCWLPADKVCYVVEGPGCAYGLPIRVVGYDNPNLTDDPMVDVYFNLSGASIKVTSLKLVPPTIKVDPKEVPFTIPATATHITFTVTDAHGHNPSDIGVEVLNVDGNFGAGASGYSWYASAGTTGCKGEVDWAFTPPFSGKYKIKASPKLALTCELPCRWLGINTTATFEAVYKAPVVDTEAPKVEVTAPAEVTTSTVKITGKATDNVGVVAVWIGAKQASLAPDGTFEAVLDNLAVGDNTFTVSAYDAANNVGTKSVTVKYIVPQVTKIVLKIGSDIMTVNGKAVQLDAAAEIKNGRTFLPLRAIAEVFGATVTWVPETQGITVVLGDTQIGLQIGNNTAVVNGNVISIEPPYIKNSRTMVPFRVISEAFGADVQWDPINYIVTVTMQG